MTLQKITYTHDGKKHSVKAKVLTTIPQKFLGLMFRDKSPPLFFVFNRNKKLSIHSLFCKPFRAVWLNDKMQAVKVLNIKKWKLNISGRGRYLLEIPTTK